MTEQALVVPDSKALTVDQELLDSLGMSAEQLSSEAHAGFENLRPEDYQIPRLQIAQAMSPQLVRSKPEYIPNLMVGQYFNTVTGEIYGDSVIVVPVRYSVSRIQFKDKAIDCRSSDGIEGAKSPLRTVTNPKTGKLEKVGGCAQCQFAKWGSGKDGKGTDCKEYRNWLLLDPNGSPISMSFKSSSLVVAKQWITLLSGRKILVNGVKQDAPRYLTTFELKAVEKQSTLGTFLIPSVKVIGPTPGVIAKIASDLNKSFKGEIADNAVDHEE
jgi:hypothetical protein